MVRTQMRGPNRVRAEWGVSALGFHGWADRYLEQYRALPEREQESAIAFLLLCRAIEMEFKAWHRQASRGAVLQDRWGHNILACYRALPVEHCILSEGEVAVLEHASSAYAAAGFEDLKPARLEPVIQRRSTVARLEAVVEKTMRHGDGLRLRWH